MAISTEETETENRQNISRSIQYQTNRPQTGTVYFEVFVYRLHVFWHSIFLNMTRATFLITYSARNVLQFTLIIYCN